jgi:hypothetical protein
VSIPLLYAERHWVCPNCDLTAVTRRADAHTEFHNCSGLAFLWSPMIEHGIKAKVHAVERGDYVGSEDVRHDGNGRPIMSVITTRDDGQDCVAYAATAHGRMSME